MCSFLFAFCLADLPTFDWVGSTRLSPSSTLILAAGLSSAVFAKRSVIAILFIVVAVLLPPGQRLVIGSLDFPGLRLLSAFTCLAMVARGEFRGLRWVQLDAWVLAIGLFKIVGATVRDGQSGLVSSGGNFVDLVISFFVLRALLRDYSDWRKICAAVGVMAVLTLFFMSVERLTGRNFFSALGGVPEVTSVRNGRMRCQAAFPHPILAGAFFAGWLPVMVGLWLTDRSRIWVVSGLACLGVVGNVASSTPLSGILIGIIGWLCFPARRALGMLRLMAVLALVAAHFALNNGVASLFAKVDLVGGSTGRHRYLLIKAGFERIGDWWLVGLDSTAHWGPGLWDITNQYLIDGVRGGLGAFVARLATLVWCFRAVGAAVRKMELGQRNTPKLYFVAYGIGVGIFSHACMFLSVSYFGQSYLAVLILMAGAASLRDWEPRTCPSNGPGTSQERMGLTLLNSGVSIRGYAR